MQYPTPITPLTAGHCHKNDTTGIPFFLAFLSYGMSPWLSMKNGVVPIFPAAARGGLYCTAPLYYLLGEVGMRETLTRRSNAT